MPCPNPAGDNLFNPLEQCFSTGGVPQRGARGAASYHISMDFMPILTPRGAAKYWNRIARVP